MANYVRQLNSRCNGYPSINSIRRSMVSLRLTNAIKLYLTTHALTRESAQNFRNGVKSKELESPITVQK